ncbi:MAG: oligosaccharide flippase family protein [Propionibacteriaceae bacterium]|nr:oligosaccharide flippase family protein [Propionibacteriaceae bacterium]
MSEVKSGAVLAYANVAVSNVVALLYTPFVIRVLGQNEYGVYRLSDSVISALLILNFGFGVAYVRFYTRLRVKNDSQGISNLNGMYLIIFCFMGLLACVGGGLIVFFAEGLFGGGLSPAEIVLAKRLMVLMTINVAMTFPSSVFSSYLLVHERFKALYGIAICMRLGGTILGIVLLLFGFGAFGATLATTISTFMSLTWTAFFAKRLGMEFQFFPFRFHLLREIASFSFWVFLSLLFNIFSDNAPNFILASRSSSADVALFSVAFLFRHLFFSVSTALSNVFTPRVNFMVAKDASNDSLLSLMMRVGRYQLMVHFLLLGGFIITGRFFITMWAGEEFSSTYQMVILLAAITTIPLVQNVGIAIQQAKNRHKFRSIVYLISALLGAMVCWMLAPHMGALGATVGYCVIMVLGPCLAMNWYYHARMGLNMVKFWSSMWKTLLVALVCTGVFLWICETIIDINSLSLFAVVGLVFTACYSWATWRITMQGEERKQVKDLLRRTSDQMRRQSDEN